MYKKYDVTILSMPAGSFPKQTLIYDEQWRDRIKGFFFWGGGYHTVAKGSRGDPDFPNPLHPRAFDTDRLINPPMWKGK